MRIGIIGTGGVAQNLGSGFLAKGHEVAIGTRDPKAAAGRTQPDRTGTPGIGTWLKANPKVKVVTQAEAAKWGDLLVFAVHGAQVADAVQGIGANALAGKVVIDTTNPLEFGANGAHVPKSIPDSCLQVAQRAAPKARFVKAFNCTPGHLMLRPPAGGGDQLICGDDAAAKEQVAKLLKEFGWGVADVGDASMGPYVEGAALAVINWAAKTNDWGWVIKLNGRTK